MLENMAGTVGFAIHEDRLAKAMRNLRVIEAERTAKRKRDGHQFGLSINIAKALTALATRLDGNVTMVGGRTGATVR